MKRLKGPELKMPDVKVPPFARDVYWDLRDRRLLPLVAVIAVAIVAVPFLLGGDSDLEPQPVAEDPTASISSELENARAADLVVVEATPGLRDYRKRLAGRTPTNPFKAPPAAKGKQDGNQLPELPSEASSAGATAESGSAVDGESGSTGGESGAPDDSAKDDGADTAPNGGGSGNGGGDSGKLTFYTFAIDARITRAGGNDSETRKASKEFEPVVKERTLPLTGLPGEKAPVVTYMGASKKGQALLMVSNDVNAVFGETKCISGDDICQLLEAEPGFPVTFVYGAGEIRYTIKVLKIYPVVTGRR